MIKRIKVAEALTDFSVLFLANPESDFVVILN